MRIAVAQINTTTGDIAGNVRKVREWLARAGDVDLVAFPDMALSGLGPGDLVKDPAFLSAIEKALRQVGAAAGPTPVLVGHPRANGRGEFVRSASLFAAGACLGTFDGPPVGAASTGCATAGIARLADGAVTVALGGVPEVAPESGWGEALVALTAESFCFGCVAQRGARWAAWARKSGVPTIVVNAVGGCGERVFDGGSAAFDGVGALTARAPLFAEDLLVVDTGSAGGAEAPPEDVCALLYEALKLGLRDFACKSGFSQVVLGLSGGVDSAVVATLSADALGADRVTALGMPSGYSSEATRRNAEAVASNLGIRYHVIAIDELRGGFDRAFASAFESRPPDVAGQNIQARIRGTLLMAYANRFQALPLACGNRSEIAVGYCTLYGDTAGGLAPIGDVPKTMVYELAGYLSKGRAVIPRQVIEQAPSAELRPGQRDQDDLPPYDVLDAILALHLDEGLNTDEIIGRGLEPQTVRDVIARLRWADFKRRQSPPVLRAFSKRQSWLDLPLAARLTGFGE